MPHLEPVADPSGAVAVAAVAPSPVDIGRQLAEPLRAFFTIEHVAPLPARLNDLMVRLNAAMAATGETVTADFRDALMNALPALRTFAFSLAGDITRAEDLVQETALKAWSNHHRFEPGSRLLAWLFTIMRNQFYTDCRKRRREVEDVDGYFAEQMQSVPDQEDVSTLRAVCAKLDALPARQREALLLVGAEGFTYEAAAEQLGCRTGTIKSRVSRARTSLSGSLGLGEVDG